MILRLLMSIPSLIIIVLCLRLYLMTDYLLHEHHHTLTRWQHLLVHGLHLLCALAHLHNQFLRILLKLHHLRWLHHILFRNHTLLHWLNPLVLYLLSNFLRRLIWYRRLATASPLDLSLLLFLLNPLLDFLLVCLDYLGPSMLVALCRVVCDLLVWFADTLGFLQNFGTLIGRCEQFDLYIL